VGDHRGNYALPAATLLVLNNLRSRASATCRKILTTVGNTTDISVSIY